MLVGSFDIKLKVIVVWHPLTYLADTNLLVYRANLSCKFGALIYSYLLIQKLTSNCLLLYSKNTIHETALESDQWETNLIGVNV